MDTIDTPDAVDRGRRMLLGAAALSFAATELGMARPAQAQSAPSAASAPSPFAAIKQVEAGPLDIGYAELGPPAGQPVILLHGWPYDIHTCVEVAPILAARGYRVIVPYLRGYGSTRFLSGQAMRNAQ